jgi:hypothetical protein
METEMTKLLVLSTFAFDILMTINILLLVGATYWVVTSDFGKEMVEQIEAERAAAQN